MRSGVRSEGEGGNGSRKKGIERERRKRGRGREEKKRAFSLRQIILMISPLLGDHTDLASLRSGKPRCYFGLSKRAAGTGKRRERGERREEGERDDIGRQRPQFL